jgi:hypothetical protein
MTDPIVVTVCLALLIAWVIDKRLERRSVETQIAEDTCEEHAVFCCPWCFGAKDDDAPGRDTCRVMPDDGFGNKAASGSFLLRLCKEGAESETADGGRGEVRIAITLHHPNQRIPHAIVDALADSPLSSAAPSGPPPEAPAKGADEAGGRRARIHDGCSSTPT